LAHVVPPHSTFGRLRGSVSFDGVSRRLDAIARVGVSFTGLGLRNFIERRMLWACAHAHGRQDAVELRALDVDSAIKERSAYILQNGAWQMTDFSDLELETSSPYVPPKRIAASIAAALLPIRLEGTADTFMTLSRPGPDGTRIHTSLGFAIYRLNGVAGAGMYEYSRRAGEPASADSADENDED
jgi:hypothetical protein